MKRAREEPGRGKQKATVDSQRPLKLARGSTGSTAASKKRATREDALAYMKMVKTRFAGSPEHVYEIFVDAIKDFKCDRIDRIGFVMRVKEVLAGHPDLLLGFNAFLSSGCNLREPDEMDAAMTLLKRAKAFLCADSCPDAQPGAGRDDKANGADAESAGVSGQQQYDAFLQVLQDFRRDHISVTQALEQVTEMFAGDPILADDLTQYLYEQCCPPSPDGALVDDAHSGRRKPRGSSSLDHEADSGAHEAGPSHGGHPTSLLELASMRTTRRHH
eukprot:jgi/Mesvir1/25099/Mv21563-RA.1